MDPIPSITTRSMRKSRLRQRVLLMLASLGEAYTGQLAAACGMRPATVRWVMVGRPPYYAPELSLVALGLAEVVSTPHGRVYRITTKGLRKARSIAASRARRVAREPVA